MANQVWGDSNSPPAKTNKKFIEALRQAGEIPSDLQSVEKKKKELEKKYRERLIFHTQRIKEEEKEIYSRDKREARLEIEALKQEVEALAQEANNLEKILDVAAQQPIVNPGISDISFLRSLKNTIKNFLREVENSSIWLSAWNQKNKKKGFFWNMFASKKGGANFLLSSEHYVSRAAG